MPLFRLRHPSNGPSLCAPPTQVGFTSGGGFSDFFSRPEYQQTSVQRYLDSGAGPPSDAFNASGRAYPDVAALGVGLQVYENVSLAVDRGAIAPTTV
jgi:tripeptidyl-peptidase I